MLIFLKTIKNKNISNILTSRKRKRNNAVNPGMISTGCVYNTTVPCRSRKRRAAFVGVVTVACDILMTASQRGSTPGS
jgi:hypothetical protein